MTIALRILIIAALQTAALGYMIFDRTSILNSPDVVTLKVKPVDPSDMFRGDYVILNYDITMLDLAVLPGDDNYVHDGWAYVTLGNENGTWVAKAVNNKMPPRAAGTVVLRGRVFSASTSELASPGAMKVEYGIESFFVPQGEGKPIEDERQKGDLTAEIAVDGQGRGAIKSLRRADGKVMYVESLF
ncbi:MAG: hypothetical protein GC190_15340 [Alphaproteobacteria bacterium]|nr:hypothetical protein [Alphaproteobacteria bacterium]